MQIAAYNVTSYAFNQTLNDGDSMTFAISNQDPLEKGWFKIQVTDVGGSTVYQ